MMRGKHGYTIYLVLVIGSIFSILFVIALTAGRSGGRFASAEAHKFQAKLLAQSGLVRAEFFMSGGEGHRLSWETPRFEEPVMDFGAINLAVERFGLFSRIASTGIRRSSTCTIVGLVARAAPKPLETTLTVTGHVGGLVLKNGSTVEGNITLHHGFVYERKGGKPLNDYNRRLSLRESPSLPFDTLLLPALFKLYEDCRDSLLKGSGAMRKTPAAADAADSFLSRKALVIIGDYRIDGAAVNGMALAISGTCRIGPGAKMRDVICLADKIIFEGGATGESFFLSQKTLRIEGGRHNSQFFSRDSLWVEKTASFGQLSVFTCFREENGKDSLKKVTGGIFVEDDAIVRGTVICAHATNVNRGNASPAITFGKNVVFTGWIITDGDCFLSGSDITGHLWLRSILSRDDEGSYIDFLITTRIKQESEKTPFPLIGEAPVQLMVFKEGPKYGKLPSMQPIIR